MGYLELSKQELEKEYGNLVKRFEEIKGMGLNLNMARGKRSEERRVGKECRSRWSPYH